MLVPVEFLRRYLKKSLSVEEIVAAFERTEIEVEDVILSGDLDMKIVTAKVTKVWQHPNADRLRMAKVEFAKSKPATVVCGAPNLAEGMVVAYARPGSVLPDGSVIEKVTIRGEDSAGMLCSERELGRSDDHNGIASLDPVIPLGISLCDIDNNGEIVDIKTPANRPDMLSILGLAREICANSPDCELVEPERTKIEYTDREVARVKETDKCKRFVSMKLRVDVNITSPDWLVENLRAAGMRSIHPLVDITNFVMLETGQPSHAYDSSKLNSALQVRYAKNGELLTTLDGVERKLSTADLVIADSSGPIGLAGVMGGGNSEVDQNTTEIVVEIANFEKSIIRRMAIRHGLRTEASARFEKGLPLPLSTYTAERLLYLFQSVCGAEILEGPFDQLYAWPWVQHIGLRVRAAEKFLGVGIDEKQLLVGLRKRGFEAEHFSIVKETRKHLGKPYIWGANFKQNGTEGFDCGYLVDYVYSLISQMVGHHCLQLFESGNPVEVADLRPGDAVFRDGPWEKLESKERKGLSHVAIYIGNGKIIHAADTYRGKDGKWKKYPKEKQMVIEESVEVITKDPDYRGARRYVDNFNHIIAVTAPWWREDVRYAEDLYEEAAKIVGYENMSATLPQLPPTDTSKHQMVLKLQELRNTLVTKGLFEVMTYSFVNKNHLALLSADEDSYLKIVNPLSREQEYLRQSLLMSHVQVVANNREYWQDSYVMFEISRTYRKSLKAKDGKEENWRLAITAIGSNSAVKVAAIVRMLSQKYVWQSRVIEKQSDLFVPGRSAEVILGKKHLGSLGQLTPKILRPYKVRGEVSFLELTLNDDILAIADPRPEPTYAYQYTARDITIEVDTAVWWQDVVDGLPLSNVLKKIHFVSVYSNDELIAMHKKRLSLRVWLDCGAQPKPAEIVKLTNKCVQQLKVQTKLKNLKVC